MVVPLLSSSILVSLRSTTSSSGSCTSLQLLLSFQHPPKHFSQSFLNFVFFLPFLYLSTTAFPLHINSFRYVYLTKTIFNLQFHFLLIISITTIEFSKSLSFPLRRNSLFLETRNAIYVNDFLQMNFVK